MTEREPRKQRKKRMEKECKPAAGQVLKGEEVRGRCNYWQQGLTARRRCELPPGLGSSSVPSAGECMLTPHPSPGSLLAHPGEAGLVPQHSTGLHKGAGAERRRKQFGKCCLGTVKSCQVQSEDSYLQYKAVSARPDDLRCVRSIRDEEE